MFGDGKPRILTAIVEGASLFTGMGIGLMVAWTVAGLIGKTGFWSWLALVNTAAKVQ